MNYKDFNISGLVIFGSSYFIDDEERKICLLNRGYFEPLMNCFSNVIDDLDAPSFYLYLKINCDGKSVEVETEISDFLSEEDSDTAFIYVGNQPFIKYIKEHLFNKEVSFVGCVAENKSDLENYKKTQMQKKLFQKEFPQKTKKNKVRI